MSTYLSIFIPIFLGLLALAIIFDRKHIIPVQEADSEPETVTIFFNVITPASSIEILRIIKVVDNGDKLQLVRECEDDSTPTSVLVIAPDGSVIGKVEEPYRLSFYTEIDNVTDCEATSVLLGSQLYIKAKAVFKPGSYIYRMDI